MTGVEKIAQAMATLQEENQQLKKEKAELIQQVRRLEDEVETWKAIATQQKP